MKKLVTGIIVLGLALACAGILASDQAAADPATVPELKEAILETKRTNEGLLDLYGGLQRDYFLVSKRTLADSRDLAKYQHDGVVAVFAAAGVPMPASTGTGHRDPASRGILGDVDLADLSRADYEKVLAAAKKMGYTVERRHGSSTIVELDATTFFRKTDKEKFDLDVWRDPEHLSSVSFDPKNGMVVDSPFLFVADNVKKSHGALTRDPLLITEGDLQGLAKSTMRIMDTGGEGTASIKDVLAKVERQMAENPGADFDLSFKEKLALVKSGYSPKAAGIVRAGATPEQAAADIAAFQAACSEVAGKVYAKTFAERQAGDERIVAAFDAAAAKGDADAARKLKAELLEYRSATYRAQAGAAHNGGVEALALMKGYKVSKGSLPGGEVMYRVEDRGWFLESELRAEILSKETKALSSAHAADPEPKATAKGGKRAAVTRAAGFVLDFANYYQAASMAEEEILESMEGDESMAMLVGEQMLKTAIYASDFYQNAETMFSAMWESEDRFIDELAEGKDPSLLWAVLRGTGKGVGKVIWNQTLGAGVSALTGTWDMIREGTGLVSDSLDARSAEEEARLMKERVDSYRKELDRRSASVRSAFSGAVAEYRKKHEARLREEAAELEGASPLKPFDPDKAFDDFLAEYALSRDKAAQDAYAEYKRLLASKGEGDKATRDAYDRYQRVMKGIEALTGPGADAGIASIRSRAKQDAQALSAYRSWVAASGLPPELAAYVTESVSFTAEQREGQAKVLSLAADMPRWDGDTLKLSFQGSIRTIAYPYYGYETSINWMLYWPTPDGKWDAVGPEVKATLRERVEKGDSGLYDKTYDLVITKDLAKGRFPPKGGRAYLAALGMPMNPQSWSRGYYAKHLVLTLPPHPDR